MIQISLETSKEELQNIHKIVNGDGRKKSVTISTCSTLPTTYHTRLILKYISLLRWNKGLLSSLLVDHHRMVAYLGPLVSNAED